MNSRKLIAALALSLVSAAPAVLAEEKAKADPAASVDKWFVQYDKDGDNKLTRQEFRLGGASFFDALDLDKDSILTREEAKKAVAMQPVEVDTTAMDTDQDGYITRREWTGDQAGFDKLDRDNDGVISRLDHDIEVNETRAKNRLKSLDKNNDGIVQRDEWPGNDETFRKQDANRNGTLSLDELGDRGRRK